MEMTDFEFFRITRLTKDGVTQLTERIEHRIRGQARGAPITPQNQVYLHKSGKSSNFVQMLWVIILSV